MTQIGWRKAFFIRNCVYHVHAHIPEKYISLLTVGMFLGNILPYSPVIHQHFIIYTDRSLNLTCSVSASGFLYPTPIFRIEPYQFTHFLVQNAWNY